MRFESLFTPTDCSARKLASPLLVRWPVVRDSPFAKRDERFRTGQREEGK